MEEADQNALVIRRKVTRSGGNPAHDAAVAREHRHLCSNRITSAPSPLTFKSNPGIALSDLVSQAQRRAAVGRDRHLGSAGLVQIPHRTAGRDDTAPESP